MTISILAYDEKSGSYGGAATTGSLCVGGWVLRGDAEAGLSASQGSLPSTMWGTAVLDLMRQGLSADAAVAQVVAPDTGKSQRQLSALDPQGRTANHTGTESIPTAGVRQAGNVIVSGNLLSSEAVLDACLDGFLASTAPFDQRLLDALDRAAATGGDSRGLLSAALLVVSRHAAPLTLRIDHSETPLRDLRTLHGHATAGAYADWAATVPTLDAPFLGEPFPKIVSQ
ncbi:DUF1028 domain-containing protein [Alloyangia pacifica]|uniref:DUF1028 domain-containing protein n=1 Tax=Alloyangia pacifica TaxID=311180 RepID=UPI001CFF4135|nr:DUF1028 domain-containing protein [Alloyangia pacifica]